MPYRHSLILSLLTLALPATAQQNTGSIVISQIYGGGGNQGATLTNDYVELFNRGGVAVSVNGWTIQHTSAAGNSWDRTELSGTIEPGQYFLVEGHRGAAGTTGLPLPDLSSKTSLHAEEAKVALVSSTELLRQPGPSRSDIIDFVGYGRANAAEGSPAPKLSNTTAILRADGGCRDTNDNGADFSAGRPAPRNRSVRITPCVPVVSQQAAPEITEAGVVNAASFLGGSFAPGTVVTVFGSKLGPSELAGMRLESNGKAATSLESVRALFDGQPAPLLYASASQLSAVVPFSLAGRASATLQVEYAGRKSNPVRVSLALASPAFFTLDASGRGQVAALNADYRVNTAGQPARRGEIVTLFLTGGGAMLPGAVDGGLASGELSRLVQAVSARVDGLDAEVLYAGSAPGLLYGVVQMNIRIPMGTRSGALPVVVTVAGVSTRAATTVAVE